MSASFSASMATPVVLHLHAPDIVATPPSLREQLLSRLTNPNLAVLLIALGGLLIYLEFNVPGTIVPGTLGAFCVLLGGFGLNLLPLHHAALLLILASLVMIGLEVTFYSHGILAIAGIISPYSRSGHTGRRGPIPELRVSFAIALAALALASAALPPVSAGSQLRALAATKVLDRHPDHDR